MILLWAVVAAFTQEAYVWQRAWTEPVEQAVKAHGPDFAGLVALGAEVTSNKVFTVPVKLEKAGIALRINSLPATETLCKRAASWPAARELQLDYDCATSQLAGYRDLVAEVKRCVAPVPVVITALPAWLESPVFRELVGASDGFVLQVHSLERGSLCDTGEARKWVEQASRLGVPFRVALPTYGYVMGYDKAGKFLGIAAEGPAKTWPASATVREARADPAAMAALVREWTAHPPANCRGIIWYRLPVAGDVMNWRWPTLAAVMAGRAPVPVLKVVTRVTQPGLVEVDVVNDGEAAALEPVTVAVRWREGRVLACDALAGYATDSSVKERNATRFMGNPRLAPGQRRTIGWIRFRDAKEVVCETRIE